MNHRRQKFASTTTATTNTTTTTPVNKHQNYNNRPNKVVVVTKWWMGKCLLVFGILCIVLLVLQVWMATTITSMMTTSSAVLPVTTTTTTLQQQYSNKNDNLNIFFIHLGKTGGETIRNTLKPLCDMKINSQLRQICFDRFYDVVPQPPPFLPFLPSSNYDDHDHDRKNNKITESLLSQHIIGAMHCDLTLGYLDHATMYLWSLRNPIDRFVSWFHYMNPANCRRRLRSTNGAGSSSSSRGRIISSYSAPACAINLSTTGWGYDCFNLCFKTPNDYVQGLTGNFNTTATLLERYNHHQQQQQQQQKLLSRKENNTKTNDTTTIPPTTSTGMNCTTIARKGIQGHGPRSDSSHLHCNHQYYARQTIDMHPETPILVIRTEYLWQDLIDIDTYLEEQLYLQQHDDDDLQKKKKKNSSSIANDEEKTTTRTSSAFSTEKGSRPTKRLAAATHDHMENITHGSDSYQYKSTLSKNASQILCCFMERELRIYVSLVQRAINLTPTNRNHTLSYLYEDKCNVSSWDHLAHVCQWTSSPPPTTTVAITKRNIKKFHVKKKS